MAYFIGVDFHKSFSYLAVLDKFGQLIKQGRIDNSLANLRSFLSFNNNQKLHAVLEAGRNWTLMYDWLEGITNSVSLAHPFKVKAIASAKIKTDKIDAGILAHLLRTNLIPMAYVPAKESIQGRSILRQRMFFVRLQTMVKNRIRLLVDKYPDLKGLPAKTLFSSKNKQWLKQTSDLSETDKKILVQDLDLLESLGQRIKQSNEFIDELAETRKDIQLLKTIPGFGTFFAALVSYEIDDINRFNSTKKISAYVGLVPSTYASGNRITHGRITKQGNKWLRWALVEAVWPAVRTDKELRTYYQRIKARKGANPAKVATARRLLTIVYHILKEQRSYQSGFKYMISRQLP